MPALLSTASLVPRYMSEDIPANGRGIFKNDAPMDREQLKQAVDSVLQMIDLNDFEDFPSSAELLAWNTSE
jgi:hypothetical protein